MRGNDAAAISVTAPAVWRTGISMFDWPEPTQTSPTRTSRIVTSLSARIIKS